jgi:hypothetical protein
MKLMEAARSRRTVQLVNFEEDKDGIEVERDRSETMT